VVVRSSKFLRAVEFELLLQTDRTKELEPSALDAFIHHKHLRAKRN
jgi:hypothetical protein